MSTTGILRKMTANNGSPIQYSLSINKEPVALNPYIGKKIKLAFTGNIYCVQCGNKTSKSFQQGHCYPCMRRLYECDMCMLHPERCHVEEGTCPQDDWAHSQCHQQHYIYLANSSGLKVGITRLNQIPTRWIDQGAVQGLVIFKVNNRFQSGITEVALKQFFNDKTNWRKMLKNEVDVLDLENERDKLMQHVDMEELCQNAPSIEVLTEKPVRLEYPVLHYPEKVSSLSFDKTPEIEGVLNGIKGQYLLLDHGVLNIRKFSGYEIVTEA